MSRFLTDADSAGGGGGFTHTTAVYTTASLADAAQETGVLLLPGCVAYRVYRVSADVASRVRAYTTTAKRDADVSRAIGVVPTGDHGLIFDVIGSADVLSLDMSPVPEGWLPGTIGQVPITVDNTSGATSVVNITVTYVRSE
jgi:hypothetical protein